MPQDSPQNSPQKGQKNKGAVNSVVRAERLMQIAFILPAAVVVGWLAGAGLDKWLHQHWIYLAGIILGCVAGFIEIFRLVQNNEKEMEKDDQ
ncbi:MAG TPA: AtpZ/AtpI family protein [Acidobacteriaceae bacterium]|jgi:F0F1-type ATP synthase assembly protein I